MSFIFYIGSYQLGSHGTPAGLDSGMEMSPRLCHKEEGSAPVELLSLVWSGYCTVSMW